MFKFFKNSKKQLYKRYVNAGGEEREKVLAEIVEKYKSFSEKEKYDFRKTIGKKMLKAGKKEEIRRTLELAGEVGRATGWKEHETDAVIVEPIINILEKQNDAELAIAALEALYENNYGEAEFWEKMLHKEPAVAVFVIEKIKDVEGAEEVFRKNLRTLIPLMDQNKTCREIVAKFLKEADGDIKKSLLEKMIKEGMHEEFIEALPSFLESGQTRHLLLGWLATNNIRIKIDKKEVPGAEEVRKLARRIKQAGEDVVKKAATIIPKLPPEERLLVNHFLLMRGVNATEDDGEFLKRVITDQKMHPALRKTALDLYMRSGCDHKEEFVAELEEKIDRALESASAGALREAYDMGTLLAVLKPEKGMSSLEKIYGEAVDVLKDEEADGKQREIAAAVCFLYTKSFRKNTEETKEVCEKALAILKKNGRVILII